MKNLIDFIPKTKHDIKKIEELAEHPYPFYQPILKYLFEWIQDINWPVAFKIVPLLIRAEKDCVPIIKEILKTKDYVWQYWVLQEVLEKMPKEIIIIFQEDLLRIKNKPNAEEKKEELDLVASEILKKL